MKTEQVTMQDKSGIIVSVAMLDNTVTSKWRP